MSFKLLSKPYFKNDVCGNKLTSVKVEGSLDPKQLVEESLDSQRSCNSKLRQSMDINGEQQFETESGSGWMCSGVDVVAGPPSPLCFALLVRWLDGILP